MNEYKCESERSVWSCLLFVCGSIVEIALNPFVGLVAMMFWFSVNDV